MSAFAFIREFMERKIAFEFIDGRKSKQQAKRQRQKEAKKKVKEEESKKKLFVRIKTPFPGRPCCQYNQVVKSWTEDIKPSFYQAIGWFEM